MPTPIAERLGAVRTRVARACGAAGRRPAAVTLVAVTKGVPVDRIEAALDAGQRDFGESYLQEALPKIEAFAAVPRERPTWHFVGPIQGNKAAGIAAHFAWAHAVDREKIARRLSALRPAGAVPLNVCVQVNVSGEATKAGVAPEQAAPLCRAIAALPGLRLRGLMAIPAPVRPGHDARAPFRQLRELFERLTRAGHELDTLSMGMSDDFEAAIAEGSTLIRVGTAIFGPRAA
jgi:hypothetical protein